MQVHVIRMRWKISRKIRKNKSCTLEIKWLYDIPFLNLSLSLPQHGEVSVDEGEEEEDDEDEEAEGDIEGEEDDEDPDPVSLLLKYILYAK